MPIALLLVLAQFFSWVGFKFNIVISNFLDESHMTCFYPSFGLGGEYDGDRKIDDLKLLYRTYVTDSLSNGRMEEDKVHLIIPNPCTVLSFNV